MIAAPFTPMLRTANLLENLLTSINMTEEDKVIDRNIIENVSG